MPFFWIREGSNFVAIKFTTPSAEKVAETFATPATTDNVDSELLGYFKGTSVGDAIEISLKDSGLKTERSLKVRVGKHAKMANRELEYRKTSDGAFMIRVSAVLEEPTVTTNGTVTTEVTPSTENEIVQEEAATTGRGRR